MTFRASLLALAAMAVMGLGMQSASANTISTVTFNNSSDKNATATFTFNSGSLSVVVVNNIDDPNFNDIGSALRGLSFTISQSPSIVGTSATLTSATGTLVTVGSGGVITAEQTGANLLTTGDGWAVSGTDPYTIGIGAPNLANSPLILGNPSAGGLFGTYTAANGSIANNSGHNPLVEKQATFTLNITGLSANATLTSARMFFGTSDKTGDVATVINETPVGEERPTPLPASVWGGAALIGGLAGFRRLKRKTA